MPLSDEVYHTRERINPITDGIPSEGLPPIVINKTCRIIHFFMDLVLTFLS